MPALLGLVVLLAGCATGEAPAPADPSRPGAPAPEAGADPDREAEVLAVVHGLFDAMGRKDVGYLEDVFHPDARLVTTAFEGGEPFVASVPAERFIRSVAGAEGRLEEVVWDEEVRIRDNLSTVWTEYTFYLDGELHHCGVNAFQLARTLEGWKIVQVADTRREEGCEDRR